MAKNRYVKSRVAINKQEISKVDNNMKQALVMTAEQLHSVICAAKVIPRADGALSDEQFIIDESEIKNGKVYLVHATRYARRLYYHPEYNFHREPWEDEKGRRHDGNPNAQGKWYTEWLPGGKYGKDIPKWFQIRCRQLGG